MRPETLSLNAQSKLRFAPSPTGFLHVGGARTALFNFLLAKNCGGKFVLRIEDTDTERNRPEFEAEILKSLAWLGIKWDEGPYYQTKRFEEYRSFVKKLLEKGSAYKCYCTEEAVEKMRKDAEAKGNKPMYDRTCRNLKSGEKSGNYCVRIKAPLSGEIVVHDSIKGDVRVSATELDDFVILRTNNTPTYNLTVVVDDVEMGITHVVRGEEHLNNTPKQLILFEAAGLTPPQFAHIPLILAPDKSKLSKRHGAVAVSQFREEGYLPEALVNYLAKLGWSGGDQEFYSTNDLIKVFDAKGFGTSGSVFDKTKLDWFNNHYIRQLPLQELCSKIKEITAVDFSFLLKTESSKKLFEAIRERASRLTDIPAQLGWMIADIEKPLPRDPEAVRTILEPANSSMIKNFLKILETLAQNSQWSATEISNQIKVFCGQEKIKIHELAKPLRVLIAGTPNTPDIGLVLEVLGFEKINKRCLEYLKG